MSQVVILGERPRDGGMIELLLSQDSTRFIIHVPAILRESEDFDAIVQLMANTVARQANTLRGILETNRGL